jgi:hypothetical protein
VPLGVWRGDLSFQLQCVGIALLLVLGPGVATLVITTRLGREFIYGPLLALAVGTFVRVVIGFGGGVLIFLASKPTFHVAPMFYWGWLLGIYVLALAIETILLAQSRSVVGVESPPRA